MSEVKSKATGDKLSQRAAIKKRKPTYKRVQSHQFSKLSDTKWRKPKGMGNKVRRNRRGKPSMPTVGFGSPKEVRGLNKNGMIEVVVSSVKDLEGIDTKTQVAVLSKTLGSRKKLEVLAKAKSLKVNVSNVKDVDSKIKELTKEKKTKKAETKTDDKKEAKSEDKGQKTKDKQAQGGKEQ